MGRRTLLVIASVLVAATGTALIWMYVQGADERARGRWQALITVLVATENIPVGAGKDVVTQQSKPVEVPRDLVPARPITDPSSIGTRTTTTPILTGQYIVEGQFASANAPIGVADGKMAVAFSMNDPNRVASLLRPGSLVEVFRISSGRGGRDVQMLLPKVKVIGVGDLTAFRNPDGGAARMGAQGNVSTAMVTLEVSGREAANLIAWNDSLYFALLGKGAEGNPDTDRAVAAVGSNPANS